VYINSFYVYYRYTVQNPTSFFKFKETAPWEVELISLISRIMFASYAFTLLLAQL